MHNPLQLLFREALDELLLQGHAYFIRQSYPRGRTDASIKEAFLLTPYKDPDTARLHLEAIRQDPRKLLYNALDPPQREKLYKAAAQPAGYRVYLNRLKDREWKPPAHLVAGIRQYIARAGWRPGRGKAINAELALHFGELIIKLQNGDREIQISLNDLEKI